MHPLRSHTEGTCPMPKGETDGQGTWGPHGLVCQFPAKNKNKQQPPKGFFKIGFRLKPRAIGRECGNGTQALVPFKETTSWTVGGHSMQRIPCIAPIASLVCQVEECGLAALSGFAKDPQVQLPACAAQALPLVTAAMKVGASVGTAWLFGFLDVWSLCCEQHGYGSK